MIPYCPSRRDGIIAASLPLLLLPGVILLNDAGLLKYSLALALFPFAAVLALRASLNPKIAFSTLFSSALLLHYILSQTIISIQPLLFLMSLLVAPFVLIENRLNNIAAPKYWFWGLSLLGFGIAVSVIGAAANLRTAGGSFGFSDLLMIQSFCIMLATFWLLQSGWITLRQVVLAIIAGSALIAGYLYFSEISDGGFRFISSRFGVYTNLNPNAIAIQFDLILPLCATLALFPAMQKRWTFLMTGSAAVALITLLLTVSRGSLPGISLCALFVFWRLRRSRVAVAIAVLSMLALGALLLPPFLIRIMNPPPSDVGSNLGRVFLLQSALKLLDANHYVFGAGMDSFRFLKYDFGFPLWFNPIRSMSSHNLYLEIAMGWGVVALLGWCILAFGSIWSLFVYRSKDSESELIAKGLMLSLLAYSLHGIVDSAITLDSLNLQLFVLLGCAAYLLKGGSWRGVPNR